MNSLTRNLGTRLDLCWWPYCTDMLAYLGTTDMDETVVLAFSFQSRIHERSVLVAVNAHTHNIHRPSALEPAGMCVLRVIM